MKTLLVLIALTFAPTHFAQATSANDVKDKASETVGAAADYTKEQKDAFIKDMEDNLAGLKKQIQAMKEKTGQTKDESVQKLEKKQKKLEADLAQMKKSSGKAWDKLKSGMSKAWDEVKDSFGDAKEELQK